MISMYINEDDSQQALVIGDDLRFDGKESVQTEREVEEDHTYRGTNMHDDNTVIDYYSDNNSTYIRLI